MKVKCKTPNCQAPREINFKFTTLAKGGKFLCQGCNQSTIYGLLLESENVAKATAVAIIASAKKPAPPVISGPKCQCGAASVGSNHHSSWCQMSKATIAPKKKPIFKIK